MNTTYTCDITKIYPPQFVRRAKGQRYEKQPVGDFDFHLSRFPHRVVGQFTGTDGYGGLCQFNAVLVTINGREWPCYQRVSDRVSDRAGSVYVICFNMQYRSVAVQS